MIILYEIKKFFKEIPNLVFLLALPIIMLYVLGKTSAGFTTVVLENMQEFPAQYELMNLKEVMIPSCYGVMDYFGITMLMMMSFLTCILGANSYSEEYRQKTINRLLVAKHSRFRIFIEKTVGLLLVAAFEIGVFLVIAKGIYKVSFATVRREEVAILLLAFVNSILMLFLGNVIGMIFRKNTLMIIMPLFCIMMLFGGTFTGNLYIEGLSDWMPIYQLQMAAFRVGTLHTYDLFKTVSYIEGTASILMAGVAFWLFLRQDEVR